MTVLVDAAGLRVSRPDRPLFDGLSVTVTDRDRLGVVGINGCGKSTLLRVLAGAVTPDAGEIRRGRGVRVGVLDQEAVLPEGSVAEVVGGGWEAEAILDRLGMTALRDRSVSDLSGGQAKRVALARVLARPAELLVLDEPTNHLDLPAIAWMEAWLSRFRGGVLLVSHDRHLLDRVTTRMIELDRGRAYVHDGGYAGYLAARAERADRAAEAESTRRNLARRELAWLRRGAPARTRKPQARIDAALRVLEARPEAATRPEPLDIAYATSRLGDKVIEVAGVTLGYGGPAPAVLTDVTLDLDRRERLAVVGLNGSGKSTLLEALAGRLAPTDGRIETGPTVRIGYYAQRGPDLDPAARIRDLVAGPTRQPGDPADIRLMERFWFTGELPWATVGTLSGGERRRLQLLLVLAERPNVLLLDEPTNDLDLDTLRALEEFLEGWPGALVTVSHDRTFLDRATDRMVVCRDGRIGPVAGGLAGWIADGVAGARSGPRGGGPGGSAGAGARSRAAAGPGSGAGAGSGAAASSGRPGGGRPAGPAGHPRRSAGGDGGDTSGGAGRRRSASTIGYELRQLDKELGRLTRDRDRLAATFETAGDHRDLARVGAELADAQARLDAAEERWLELAEEAEASR